MRSLLASLAAGAAFFGACATGSASSASAASTVTAQSAEDEALISAAILYNIARFSTWPEDRTSGGGETAFSVCFEPQRTLAAAFATIAGKDVGGLPVRAVALTPDRVPGAGCHVYFAASRLDRDVLSSITSAGALTVGREPRFLDRGGAVRISIDGKPRFSVNVASARQAGVKPSAKLLRLAQEVVE